MTAVAHEHIQASDCWQSFTDSELGYLHAVGLQDGVPPKTTRPCGRACAITAKAACTPSRVLTGTGRTVIPSREAKSSRRKSALAAATAITTGMAEVARSAPAIETDWRQAFSFSPTR